MNETSRHRFDLRTGARQPMKQTAIKQPKRDRWQGHMLPEIQKCTPVEIKRNLATFEIPKSARHGVRQTILKLVPPDTSCPKAYKNMWSRAHARRARNETPTATRQTLRTLSSQGQRVQERQRGNITDEKKRLGDNQSQQTTHQTS